MAEANPPTTTRNWHAAVSDEDRLLDWDTGAATQAHLIATQAAHAGSEIRTYTGDPPSDIWVGMKVGPGGVITPPDTNTTNEELEDRKSRIEQWILANIPTRGFLAYHAFVNKRRADVFEAFARMTYFRVLVGPILANDAYWNIIHAHAQFDWARFCRLIDLNSWDNGNNYALINSMRDGMIWRDAAVNEASGLITAHAQADAQNWPAIYNPSMAHQEAYEDLVASVRVL